ncbi:hypothetical protein [Dactylosporangium salmoneum]|uniref:Uncharacterized protein n=1 Tax=Dactylosporangium salmoneum TaxID=53361 RepID=A0ABN3HBS5_9ACTN
MSEFHNWDDIRAELDDGERDALAAERPGTEAWVSAFHLAEERSRLGLTEPQRAHLMGPRRAGSAGSRTATETKSGRGGAS